jgi:VCBS repeat-containing protein
LTSNPATVTITVSDSNAPVANPDTYTVQCNTQLVTVDFDTAQASPGVLANDSDADGDQLTASLASGPSDGTLTLNSDGTFTYTPNSGFTGTDSFTYTAGDGILISSLAPVTIQVIAAPSAANDSYQVRRDETLTVDSSTGVLANDTDTSGDPLTANLVSDVSHGTLALDSDGSFTYTPNPGFVGTDTFTYTADDDLLVSNTATVTLTVTGADVAPTADDATYSVVHDRVLTTTADTGVLAYASDADGDPLTASEVSGPSHGMLQLNSDGSFTYTPNPG